MVYRPRTEGGSRCC